MKSRIKRAVWIEVAVFLVLLVMLFLTHKDQNPFIEAPLESWYTDYLKYENDQWHIEAETLSVEPGKTVDLLYGPYVSLEKGDYTVSVEYECEEDQAFEPYAYKINTNYIKAEEAILESSSRLAVYQFRITEDIDNFEVVVLYNGKGDFTISGITIEKNQNDLKRALVCLMTAFAVVLIITYYRGAASERKLQLLSVIGVTVLISLPLFYRGLNDGGIMDPGGQDLVFHLMRIEGLVKELRCGNFPVRISSAWMAEYGYPSSVYYGDLFLYIPALFRMLGFSITEAYKIYVLLINLMTVLISQYSFQKMFHDKRVSTLLTLVYGTASYRLVNVYVRSAVGEYTALMFMPLIALAVYQLYSEENNSLKTNVFYGTLLAIGMSGVINAHILTAEMTVFVLALICIVCLKKTFTMNAIRTYVIAVVETLMLSAAFLVPFVDYYFHVPVLITDIVNGERVRVIQITGASIADYFAFFNNPFGNWDTMLFSPGIVLMLSLLIAVLLWYRKTAEKAVKRVTVLSLITLILASNLFPWDQLAHDVGFFNLLAQVQFPWRYVGLAIILLTVLLGMILSKNILEREFGWKKQTIFRGCTVLAIGLTLVFLGHYADFARRTVFYDTPNLDSYHMMGAEYLRTGTDPTLFDGKIHAEEAEEVELLSRIGCEMDIYCKSGEKPVILEFPVLNYKGYSVTDDEQRSYPVFDSENNLISVELPSGFDGNLYLRFEEPWYWTAALGVSMASLAVLIAAVSITGYRRAKMR